MKKILLLAGCFTGLTLITGGLISQKIPSARADSAAADDVSIIISQSCSLTSLVSEFPTADIKPGVYLADIGLTSLNVSCNGNSGWQIYAIGYGNNTDGDTDLTNASKSTVKIATGAVASGNTSGWAMKLSVGSTDAGTPVINNAYQSYTEIPSTLTEVASLDSPVLIGKTSSIRTTYSIYTIATQQAGTYNGKVKYTVVYPTAAST